MIAVKNFITQQIFNITQRIKNVEQTNCTDEVKHLREENNSMKKIRCPKISLILQFLQIPKLDF